MTDAAFDSAFNTFRNSPFDGTSVGDPSAVFAQLPETPTAPVGVTQDLSMTPALQRQVSSGVYNGNFAEGPPNPALPINDITNKLPGYSFTDLSGGTIVLTWGPDASSGSGAALTWTGTSVPNGSSATLTQEVFVRSTRTQNNAMQVVSSWFGHTGVPGLQGYEYAQPLKADGTTTGSGLGAYWIGADDVAFLNGLVLPSDAGTVLITLGFQNTSGSTHTGSIGTSEITIVESQPFTVWPDIDDPTYDPIMASASNNSWTLTYDGVIQLQMAVGAFLSLPFGQIEFPATQNPSANVNTLDDYEEDTFTPTLALATPGTSSWAYDEQHGIYQKVGRWVTVQIRVRATLTAGTGSGNVMVTGFPFTAQNDDSSQTQGFATVLAHVNRLGSTWAQVSMTANTKTAVINVAQLSPDTAFANLQSTDIAANFEVRCGGSYMADQ